MTNHEVSSLRSKGTRLFMFIMLAIICSDMYVNASNSNRKDDWGCGYSLDGIDDYASFSMGSRDTDIMHDHGFTMMFWHRNKRKDKDGHFEQCLISHSNDDHASSPILKIQLTVESKLSITMRFGESRKVTCDVDMALQDERWYHTSLSVSPSSPMVVYVNGISIKYYCVENKGEMAETHNAEHIFPAVPFNSDKPVLLGSNMPQSHGENFYRGNLADFKFFQQALGPSDTYHMLTAYPFEHNERSFPISQRILVHQPLRVNCSSGEPLDMRDIVGLKQGSRYTVHSVGRSSMGNAYTSSVRNTGTVPTADQHFSASFKGDQVSNRPFSRPGSSCLAFASEKELKRQQSHVAMLHVAGSPRMESLNLGDGLLSVMLTVSETKLAYIQFLRDQASQARKTVSHHDFFSNLGDISSFVINGENALDQLCSSLTRHFDVQMDENRIWRGYNEYAIRLEMLGHSLALILKHQGKEKNKQKALAAKVRSDLACKSRGDCSSESSKSSRLDRVVVPKPPSPPLVGIIVPATSKGVSAHELNHLTLSASLLPSLYQTRSQGFNYHIYLTVNENDPIYSNSVLTHTIFDVAYSVAKEKYFSSLNSTEYDSLDAPDQTFPKIPHRVILVPDSMLPKRALSALFNIPTLIAAYTDNCDYFYVVNDDLLLKSSHWTEKLVEPLVNNPVYPGLGVSGGIDVSDSITPQIEFPFFSRTHVELFPWCGCNPWIFKNWWEDNWLSDIYLPFDSIFYRRDVVVENYIGLDVKVTVSGSKTASADPSYAVTEGRRTPFFYMEEVEKARKRIVDMLEKHVQGTADVKDHDIGSSGAVSSLSSDDFPEVLAFVQGLDDLLQQEEEENAEISAASASSSSAHDASIRPDTIAALNAGIGYCDGIHDRTPSLLTMPVAAHEYVLDPCNAHMIAPEHRLFVPEVHSVELPHTSYAGLLTDMEATHRTSKGISPFRQDLKEAVDVCRHYYRTLENFQRKRRVQRLDDLDDDVFQDWEACVHTVGFNKFFALKAMQKNELCKSKLPSPPSPGDPPPPRVYEFDSCRPSTSGHGEGTNRLKILILHNHAPLFTRYGSDKRLYHIAETLVGLGHEVVFGGSFVSDLETEDDHLRLHHIDAKLYSPLAIDSGDHNGIYVNEYAFDAMLKKEQPDVVFMTLWFWNTPPATMLYMDIVKRLAPHARIAVVSDDAHTLREELLLTKLQSGMHKSGVESLLRGDKEGREKSRAAQEVEFQAAQGLRKYKHIRVLEYLAYAKADVVLTITENDREKILLTKSGINSTTMPQIDRGRYARGPEPDRVHDYPLIMSPLPTEKIRLIRYALSPTEIVSNFGLKLRKGERGGTIEGAKRAHLSFVGNGANPTNIAAMRWFAAEIFELIRKEIPGMQLMIIGADWDFLRTEFPHFFDESTGDVIVLRGILNQEDLTKAVVTTKVFVSPISVSTGLNTKNLLALSRGLPLVTTPLGAEGLLYTAAPDETEYDVINPEAPFVLATTAEAFAHKTVLLYNDNDVWRQVALNALRHARTSFGLSVQAHEMEEALHYAFASHQDDTDSPRAKVGDWGSRAAAPVN